MARGPANKARGQKNKVARGQKNKVARGQKNKVARGQKNKEVSKNKVRGQKNNGPENYCFFPESSDSVGNLPFHGLSDT